MHLHHRLVTTIFEVNSSGNFPMTSISTISGSTSTKSWVALTPSLAIDTSSTVSVDTQYEITYNVDSESFLTLIEGQTYSLDVVLTRSTSGSTTITHSIVANGADPAPTWASVDSTNSKLDLITPAVTTATQYTFDIMSVVDRKGYFKTVSLTVNPCQPSD